MTTNSTKAVIWYCPPLPPEELGAPMMGRSTVVPRSAWKNVGLHAPFGLPGGLFPVVMLTQSPEVMVDAQTLREVIANQPNPPGTVVPSQVLDDPLLLMLMVTFVGGVVGAT